MDVWTKEQTSTFISLLREHPCLYDILHPNYLNRMQKNNAFSLILDGMVHIRDNLSVKCLRKKLRTLQTQLSRERGKVLASRRSGAGADDVYKPTLWCYDELAFLIHTHDNPETSANFEIRVSKLSIFPIQEILFVAFQSQSQIANAQYVEETGHEHREEEVVAEEYCEVIVVQEPEEESQENERTVNKNKNWCL